MHGLLSPEYIISFNNLSPIHHISIFSTLVLALFIL
jgi:hypothetical protein